jgi:hypothetical protein
MDKTVEAYRSCILDFKSMMKTVFKEDKDTAQIIHVQRIVNLLHYQCYHNHRPDQAAATMKRCGLKIKAKITTNVWASMSKKEVAKIRIVKKEVKKKRQYEDLYGSDTLSGTTD